MTNNNNNKWQDLEKDEKKYKEGNSSGRVRQPYKRERKQGAWWEDEFSDELSEGMPPEQVQ
jgi:hypothetical protein